MARYQSVATGSWFTMEVNSSLRLLRTTSAPLKAWIDANLLPEGRFDLTTSVTGELAIDVESLKINVELFDLEMRSILDPDRYPTIEAEIVSIRELDKPGLYNIVGDVTFHGVTHRVEGDVTLDQSFFHDSFLEIKGEQTLDMRDFGVNPPSIFFMKVYPKLRVMIEILAQRVD